MNLRFWIEPDTFAALGRGGGQFEPFISDVALIFKQPAARPP
jgi:hypothetical protein